MDIVIDLAVIGVFSVDAQLTRYGAVGLAGNVLRLVRGGKVGNVSWRVDDVSLGIHSKAELGPQIATLCGGMPTDTNNRMSSA